MSRVIHREHDCVPGVMGRFVVCLAGLLSCSPPTNSQPPNSESDTEDTTTSSTTGDHTRVLVLRGGTVVGRGRADVVVHDGVIKDVGPDLPQPAQAEVVDVSGRYLVPAFIDSHVHLAYQPSANELTRRGVAAAVDLAAPLEFLTTNVEPLQLRHAGPMVTAVNGYPTQGWGAGGYGIECAGTKDVVDAIHMLVEKGAHLIKVPVTGAPVLDDASLVAAAEAAHDAGVKVVTHALADAEAARAGLAGFDVLAHTPVETLSQESLALWQSRAVISTLAAFGGQSSTLQNFANLAEGGATVLYGTDLGNTSDAGIQASEISAMQAAGLSPTQILAAGTSTPAAFWGFDDLGDVAPGKAASLLVLSDDPLQDPLTLAQPAAVYIAGVEQ